MDPLSEAKKEEFLHKPETDVFLSGHLVTDLLNVTGIEEKDSMGERCLMPRLGRQWERMIH